MNALNAYNKLNANVAGLKKSSEKLSSGYRINRAGDDAAGLAVSEKMRSQIRGLNQAVRNSQDGINMIQTFEGAAQETHSILQRMKELAEESATGTYDNMTDRAAMQLEFDQLNDELNQIADTDFNGTIVLNGGEMSDGLRQVDGEFNYAGKADQLIADAIKAAGDDANVARDAYNAAVKAFNETPFDLSEGNEYGTIGENNYDKEAADALWVAAGITKKGVTPDEADVSSITELKVEYTYGKNDAGDAMAWNVSKVTSQDGTVLLDASSKDATLNGSDTNSVAGKLKAKLAATAASRDNATGAGGFVVGKDNAWEVNAVFDAHNAKVGDTFTMSFTNAPIEKYAPNNVDFANDSIKVNGKVLENEAEVTGKEVLKVELDESLTDAKMNESIKAVLDALQGASMKFTAATQKTDTSVEITLADGSKATLDNDNGDYTFTVGEYTFKASYTAADGTLTFSNGLTDDDEIIYAKVTFDTEKAMDATVTGLAEDETIEASINFDSYNYGLTSSVDVEPGDDPDLGTSTAAQKLVDNTKADYDKALAAKNGIAGEKDKEKQLALAKEYLSGKGVSVSDAFDNSTARMTYTDNITLQVGARTKDAVNFTFNYNVDGSADMGALKANLNLSSREDGLNTANLSIANQDDANYAIDQIDKAINKTSMVRATFGSIQNRLEHKITNLTTTSENLTEAESSIRDTDMASEMMNYTKFNILQQAAQSMLAQANQQPQSILQLLG